MLTAARASKRRRAGSSRLAQAVRSARQRAGWSREALAFHAGLSWAAISQIESGRRQEVRVSSLLALAGALGTSVDYLVGSRAIFSPNLLGHRALVYRSDRELLEFAVPFLVDGLTRSDCVLAVTAPRQIGLFRDALGDAAGHVEFADSFEWYRSPGDALRQYRTFVKERFERGAPWVRIVGEPVWAGRSAAEVAAWARYESLINLSFASSPVTLVCPYDARFVQDRILEFARHTHPTLAEAVDVTASRSYRDPEDFLLTV